MALVVVVVALSAGLAAAFGMFAAQLDRPYKGYAENERFVEIPTGLGLSAIADRLVGAGIVRDRWAFRIAVWRRGADRGLRAGEYRFDRALSPLQVVDMLVRGEVYLRPLTFPEGLTVAEMASLFESKGFGSARGFLAAARRAELVRDFDDKATDLEGYLFPETYRLPRSAQPQDVVRAMVDRFREVFTALRAARADSTAMSAREIVTLASLVEKETARPEERPLVAAVYRNRLRIAMPLQADPTVIYGLVKAGRWNGNITKADLDHDSPYNTYRNPGLPPGPIASPGRGSLEAALAPADVPYVYFVSRNDGSHAFAATLEEHNANVHAYQILYFREKRLREARQGR